MSSLTPIVLLHGLGRTPRSMARLARRLEALGHQTLIPGYPSQSRGVHACATGLEPVVEAFRQRTGRAIAFVTHSMGGLVARCLATDPNDSRAIVMLAPPNRGSEVADHLFRYRLARAMLGPALADLRSGVPDKLPIPPCSIGIIAGTRAWLPFTGRVIAGPHDGLVGLARTRIAGPHDWIVVDAAHTLLMNHPDVFEATGAFLRDGRFPDHLHDLPDDVIGPAR
ncbi:alpha/beta fold hydrolase [Methylobacterium sp. E-041]|jgi:pimeloyl-ACP methyl ester carboxylesterase|uniref:alpha/beta fold hydrolase n=1 Tax=unclassified Methylobacterium TaxID=2615210 RepID=UPI001FBAF5C4|nr:MULTISPECIES: alpha/beta fold hydrolase [unclassified Methylobacterium]MCJ2008886.1 alpha/beta fold hydrolase [Methylobacterium sp. J-092]MCJ2107455.1 alpha/beta fold hydrolase [Methylobacterium sp. E-041]